MFLIFLSARFSPELSDPAFDGERPENGDEPHGGKKYDRAADQRENKRGKIGKRISVSAHAFIHEGDEKIGKIRTDLL